MSAWRRATRSGVRALRISERVRPEMAAAGERALRAAAAAEAEAEADAADGGRWWEAAAAADEEETGPEARRPAPAAAERRKTCVPVAREAR
jgi:hypothetical protein